jgi:DNA-binding MarR family transcriptional regulator
VNVLKQLMADLDSMLHERGRLAIVSALAAVPSLSFIEMRDTLEMTDGNLSIHLQKLSKHGYVVIDKQPRGKRTHTTVSLTAAGREAFTRYLDQLEAIVRQGREPGGRSA